MNSNDKVTISANSRRNFLKTLGGVGAALSATTGIVNAQGAPARAAGAKYMGDFAAPKGVAADNSGYVLVADALFDALQIFRTDGALLLGFGARGAGPGQFSLPGGLFVDEQDRVYVADSYNRRIQVFQRIGMSAEPNR